MRSSAAVAGRALIMLACVVGIPALALWGTSWSEMVKRVQDFRWPTVFSPASASTPGATDAPAASPNATPLTPAGAPNLVRPLEATAPLQPPLAPAPSAVVPADYQESSPTSRLAVCDGSENAMSTASAADPFGSIQYRLRQLGATYYLLESWGSEQQLYRFYCKMAVGGNADYTRSFEAIHADKLQAMREVLRDVEVWKGTNREEARTRN
jgi:hypothetical protein